MTRESSTLDVHCECGMVYHSAHEHIGRQIKCVKCGRLVEVKSKPDNGSIPHTIRTSATSPRVERVQPLKRTSGDTSSRRRPWILTAASLALAFFVLLLIFLRASNKAVAPSATSNATLTPSPVNDASTPAPPEEVCPSEPASLANGTRLQPDDGITGRGTLTVDNGTSTDAAIELVNTNGDVARYAYVSAHNTLKLSRIEPGTYDLLYTMGTNWVRDDFTCSQSFSQFEDELQYSEPTRGERQGFWEMTVTLHPVANGNAKTKTISANDFHRHINAKSHQN